MSAVPGLDYVRHLFGERNVRSVTANTRAGGEALLRLAGRLRLDIHTTEYPFARTDTAWADLAADRVTASVVISHYPTTGGPS